MVLEAPPDPKRLLRLSKSMRASWVRPSPVRRGLLALVNQFSKCERLF